MAEACPPVDDNERRLPFTLASLRFQRLVYDAKLPASFAEGAHCHRPAAVLHPVAAKDSYPPRSGRSRPEVLALKAHQSIER